MIYLRSSESIFANVSSKKRLKNTRNSRKNYLIFRITGVFY